MKSCGINNVEKFTFTFRQVAGSSLGDCAPTGIKGLESLDDCMVGGSEDLTEQFMLDTIVLYNIDKNDKDLQFVSENACILAELSGSKSSRRVSIEEQRRLVYSVVESSIEKDETREEIKEEKESTKEDNKSSDKEEKESTKDDGNNKRSDKDEDLLKYYESHCNGVVNELLKRYTGLFSSGYEVSKPAGILSERGILKLSGSSLQETEKTVSTTQMYAIFKEKLRLKEVSVRSVNNIASAIFSGYLSGARECLYFPNKLLEFAYGRKAPAGNNAESVNTYEEHAEAGSWKGYESSELRKSLTRLVQGSLLWFLSKTVREGEDSKSPVIIDKVSSFLTYLQKCMSMCLLMVDYKVVGGVPSVFKLRLCDPDGVLGREDYTKLIIQRAFIGGTGAVPYSYAPRFEEESFVKEYAHEFNHNISQAMPLFAYKAFEALKKQGIKPTWDNMILGKFEDGSVLKNGTHGVAMKNNLTHHVDAGSRAGKGVMTLNFLASGIYSRKNIFYLDRKPDMASMLKHLSPDMFVVNGASWTDDDTYKTFTDQDNYIVKENIPKEVLNILGCGMSWTELGDLFYMRALKLIMGIIMARGDGRYKDAKFGGSEGILLIVDEFKNFQESYSMIINKMIDRLPGDKSSFDIKKAKLEAMKESAGSSAEKMAQYNAAAALFNESYNCDNFYALSYLNHMVADLEFLSSKRDAGFASIENSYSDVFVIGQHIDHGMLPYAEYREALISGRYKQDGRFGLPRDQKNRLDLVTESFGYSLVSFKTSDAFFGRNHDAGREIYLAQTNVNSKAYGRLDDKAGNFAYLKSFSEDVRKRIVNNRGMDNINIASECIYFKPFLVLNDDSSRYVDPMYKRCEGDESVPWVTKEEIISENPDYSDPNRLNRAVGFENYLTMMGTPDYSEVLRKGVDIVNHVIHECLGYSGSWMEFITDLRPEWMFTVEDIVMGARGNKPALSDISKNPVIAEYYKFDNTLGRGGSEDVSIDGEGDFFFDGDDSEDFSHMAQQEMAQDIRMQEAMGDNDILEDGEEVSLWDDDGDSGVELNESDISETGYGDNNKVASEENERIREILDHIESLRKLGVNLEGLEGLGVVKDNETYKSAPDTEFGEDIERIDYRGDINSLSNLVDLISNDIISKFGGLERIHSLKVIGGSIIINNYCYRCRIKDLYAKNIPYDIRREINAGNIDKLFDYSLLRSMPHIRDLEFDSVSFVYDYVSGVLGYGNSISIDKFFRDFKTLQVLKVGSDTFDRSNYMKKISGNDLFYTQKKGKIYADVVQGALRSANSATWSWTKRSFQNKNQKLWKRATKVAIGGAASATVLTGRATLGVGRKASGAIGSFIRGAKDLFK